MTRRAMLVLLWGATMPRVAVATPPSTMTKIFADEPWYRARPETEREWEGVLSTRPVGAGPNTRAALGHELQLPQQRLPIYTPSASATLRPFVNQRVKIVGKQIDLTREGFGEELWPGWIELV